MRGPPHCFGNQETKEADAHQRPASCRASELNEMVEHLGTNTFVVQAMQKVVLGDLSRAPCASVRIRAPMRRARPPSFGFALPGSNNCTKLVGGLDSSAAAR